MKKFISILLCGILVLSTGVSALGAETGTGAEASGEEAVRLSLEQAVEIMQTQGSRAETAEINKNADQAVAKGYSESSRSISEQMDELSLYISAAPGSATSIVSSAQAAGLTKTNQKLVQMQRDFAAAHVEDNYQAEMNQIRADTAEFYYGLLQARENLRVCQENLQVQKDILANIERKYELGVAARIAVQTAETAVKQAEQTLAEAETAEASASMNFNMLLGYSLDREVVLTDALEKLPFPELTVEEAVAAALENRLEMEAAAYAAEVQKIQLNSLEVRYPKNSATYMKQQVAYLEAAKAERDAPIQIEMSIRI
ncbi:MAG: TolC family protein, partial [Bacillota bacterium]|nr:TolC family protein [Bacillota bacterium]